MFSVVFYNKAVFITAYNVRRINFHYYSKLRKLIIKALKQPCDKIVLNLLGVRMIDRTALEMFILMHNMASNIGIELVLINVDDDLKEYICQFTKELEVCIGSEAEYAEYTQ